MTLTLQSLLVGLGLTVLPLASQAQVYVRPAPPVVVAQPIAPPYGGPVASGRVVTTTIYADAPPPRVRYERRGRAPMPGQMWMPGYWSYNNGGHTWVRGRWEAPPRVRARWIEPRWERHNRQWQFVPGYWR